jgi:hypothetical protein
VFKLNYKKTFKLTDVRPIITSERNSAILSDVDWWVLGVVYHYLS